jgi:hypothetical protein
MTKKPTKLDETNLLTPGKHRVTIFNIKKVNGNKKNRRQTLFGGGGEVGFVITVGKTFSIPIHEQSLK